MRLRTKLLVISEVVLIVAVLVLVLPVWRAMGEQVVQNMQNELKAIASTAALEIDGDLHRTIRAPGDEQTEAFGRLREQLDEVRRAYGVDYDHIYTFYPEGEEMRFAVMLHDAPFIGDTYPMRPQMRSVLEQGTMEATPLYDHLSRQLNAARKVHASLLPERMPDVDGYDVAGASDPCDATGGDYFDVIVCDKGRMAVVVADVSGHGLGPSLLMATCRSTLRTLVRTDLSPGELVDRLDHIIGPELSEGSFITLLFGVLDTDGTFTYANAGHGPAVATVGGEVRHLEAHRPPLGVYLNDGSPPETTIKLRPGDRVILATDGIPEALDDAGRHLGVGPIERAATDGDLDCSAIVVQLREAVHEHCGGRSTTDDVTMLCVRRVR